MLSSAVSATATGIAVPTLINLGRVAAPGTIKPGISPDTCSGAYTPSHACRRPTAQNLISFNGVAGNGAGQTIAIVDAYNDPNIISDTATFNSRFGLPQFNTGGPTFQVLNQNGGTTLPQNTDTTVGDWDLEESLDVQWVHSMARKRNIILFEVDHRQRPGHGHGRSYCRRLGRRVRGSRNSWGEDEFLRRETRRIANSSRRTDIR